MSQAQRLFWEQSSHHLPLCEGEDATCLVPHKRDWEAPVPAAAMSHIFPCVQGGAKEVLSPTQETWCPSTRNSTPMPSCADEDVTCEVPHDERNRRPPSLLAEALSSACPVPTPRVFSTRRGAQGLLLRWRGRVLTLLPSILLTALEVRAQLEAPLRRDAL